MTMSVGRGDGDPRDLKVTMTTADGFVTVTCQEHFSHLRSFWNDLGRLLKEVEAEEANLRKRPPVFES